MRLVRGTHDLVGEPSSLHNYIIGQAHACSSLFGYRQVDTPLLEYESLFLHTLGETSDIVRKEMFYLEKRAEEQDAIVLRPEGTAPLMRALFLEGLQQTLPQKFFYAGPMFRYDRPQKGRLRQFHQFGIEYMGTTSPWSDVEAIILAQTILEKLQAPSFSLEINTLGDKESRHAYREALVTYFTKVKDKLSEDSKERLHKNPLRILDSKDPQDRALLSEAPLLKAFLTPTAKNHFDKVLNALTQKGIPYKISSHLVRGLDYYCHTIFEFTTSLLGAQATLLGGGRYDDLSVLLGQKEQIPSVGWAAGIERIALTLQTAPSSQKAVAILPLGEEEEEAAFSLANLLWENAIPCYFLPEGKIAQKMKKADRLKASIALILGSEEIKTSTCQVKNLTTGTQESISFSQIIPYLKQNL